MQKGNQNMKKTKPKKEFKTSDILIGIVFTLMVISIGVIFTVNFRPLYYFDINYLNIKETSGYDEELIRKNYNALIEYNSPFYKGELELPDLPSSPQGLQHFVEVKDIFAAVYFLAFTSLITCILIIIYKQKKKDYSYLLLSSITVILLPIIIGVLVSVNFDRAFVVFHKIFFRNDYWIFNEELDPVIKILPQTFFLHCLLLILFILVLGSGLLFLSHRLVKRKT